MVGGGRRIWLVIGFALPHVWLHAISSLQSLGVLAPYAQALYYLCMGGVLLAGSRWLPAPLNPQGRLATLADGSAAAVLCAIALISGGVPSLSGPVAGALLALGGCGTAWVLLRWFVAICRLGERGDAVRFVLLSFVVTAAARLVLVALPSWLGVLEAAVVAVGPVASVAILRSAGAAVCPAAAEPAARDADPAPSLNAVYLVELCACALVLGAFKLPVAASAYASLSLGVNYALRMLVPVAILIALDSAPFKRLYRPMQGLVLAVLVGVLAFSLLGGEAVGAIMADALLSLARNFALIVIYLVALQGVYCQGILPLRAFGVARGVFDCSLGVGIAIGPLLGFLGLAGVPGTNVVLFCAGVVFLLVMNRLITYVYRYHAQGSAHAQPVSLDDVCRALRERRGLTDREVQILQLLCRGFSKGHIAQKLQLSENTVRWHSKNLYEKLGIHSKQELLELVGDGRFAGE